MLRDHLSLDMSREWIMRQLPQEEIISLSDFVIINDGKADLEQQIDSLLNQIYHQSN